MTLGLDRIGSCRVFILSLGFPSLYSISIIIIPYRSSQIFSWDNIHMKHLINLVYEHHMVQLLHNVDIEEHSQDH